VSDTGTLVLRPSRSNYIYAGVFLFLAVIVWVIIQARSDIKSPTDAILALLVVGSAALVGISQLLSAAVARVTVDGDTVHVRDRLGRRRSFTRAEVSIAARRSTFAPIQAGITMPNAFLLANKDGRCLLRLQEIDYDPEALERLVATLGLAWPHSEKASVRQINREFPGAYAFDYQTVAIAIMIVLAVILAVIVSALLFR
jgi:hypothetical protein